VLLLNLSDMKKIFSLVFLSILFPCSIVANLVFRDKVSLKVTLKNNESTVVKTAFGMLQSDYREVFGQPAVNVNDGQVIIATIGNNSFVEKKMGNRVVDELKSHTEGFAIKVIRDKLYILGSDKRGTAYGILELSRIIGVSPWIWWADSPILRKSSQTLKDGFFKLEYPSVKFRGIFINDEDWGMVPWSSMTYEPIHKKGSIGPKTHARIFELLLRLRANTFWPAMHAGTVPFFLIKGNKEIADKYGIIIGSSHCEPMVCNANGEWKYRGKGDYNYVTNRENLLNFWKQRVQQLVGSDNLYTLGLRGIHDGPMQGAKGVGEQKKALGGVIKDQREMLAKYINSDVKKVPQVFIPYKEVLDVYNAGLKVPDDVTLMWCDDNYGYINHFPSAEEDSRKGGNGIYYHVSYWGRPHDYIWLATTHPALLYTQMKNAYDHGIRNLWILNVGDIKPAEYLIELYMDMAWNINAIEDNENGLQKHLGNWLTREFGDMNAKVLLPVMNEYYRLAYIRKPEFMGNTRVEETDSIYKFVKDLPWSKEAVEGRISDYTKIENTVIELSKKIFKEKYSSWFQLIEYPVRAAAEMNKKMLYAQLARHGFISWNQSDAAYDTIVAITKRYNLINHGKWNNMMDYAPRRLKDFAKVPHISVSVPMEENKLPFSFFNGHEYSDYKGTLPVCYGMGYQNGAISLSKGSSVTYNLSSTTSDSVMVEVDLVPNHPFTGKFIRYSISVDDTPTQIVDFHTEGRSEEWKMNVLRNQAVRYTMHKIKNHKQPIITITAVDDNVVVDQIKVWNK
jgi:hypothetical protein